MKKILSVLPLRARKPFYFKYNKSSGATDYGNNQTYFYALY